MKNKKHKKVYLSLLILAIFTSAFQLSGCDSTNGKFLPTSPDGNSLTLSVSPASVAANGIDIATITATVTGSATGAVSFSADSGTLSAVEVNVNSSGVAEVTMTNSIVGTATVTATAGEIVKTVSVTFGATNSLFITAIDHVGVGGAGAPFEVDDHQISDCDGVATTTDPESFGDDEATISISNLGKNLVNFTSYQISYSGVDTSYTIPNYTANLSAQILSEDVATVQVTLMKVFGGSTNFEGSKTWYRQQYHDSLESLDTFTVTYTLYGTDLVGESVSVTGSVEMKIGAYDNC